MDYIAVETKAWKQNNKICLIMKVVRIRKMLLHRIQTLLRFMANLKPTIHHSCGIDDNEPLLTILKKQSFI